jgi:hypothetical protein
MAVVALAVIMLVLLVLLAGRGLSRHGRGTQAADLEQRRMDDEFRKPPNEGDLL